MKRIAIRCDAGFAIGSGHLMRCLTLAEQLREQGAQVSFICRLHDGHLSALVGARGFPLIGLPAPLPNQNFDGTPAHAAWLGAGWQLDAEQTLAALLTLGRPDWLIVDHYAIDARWESMLRPAVGHLMAIDDLADRAHDCDLLLDQNLVADLERRYDRKLPAPCLRLLGPHYALLQPSYAQLHTQLATRTKTVPVPLKTVLIYFGGADNHNLTGCAIDAILSLTHGELMVDVGVDVVVGANGPHTEAVRRQIAGHPQFRLHGGLPTLAPLMMQADLAIGAGGATSWERLCLGLPALVVTLAENQIPVAAELASKKLIHWLGSTADITAERIAAILLDYLEHGVPAAPAELAALVDGHGCARVAAAILDYPHPFRPGDAA